MAKDFHNKPFDDETVLKLEIFRGYIREWLPVFLSRRSFSTINIFDFFAGPGRDIDDKSGSPLIVIDEVKDYLSDPSRPHAQDVKINLYFNDDVKAKYHNLKKALEEHVDPAYVNVEVDNKDFTDAFQEKFKVMAASNTANLVILDQSGVKHITKDVFKRLSSCRATDILFFISSAIIKRFAGDDCIGQYFPGISKKQIDSLDKGHIHRFICNEYYRKLVPSNKSYYLAPFSIKKGSNIYGLIFGSANLQGLEKFLKVCWNKDSISGDANYDIDDDIIRNGKTLFPEYNISQKKDDFREKLFAFLYNQHRSNNDLYKFTLEYGCLPKHTKEILRTLQKEQRLQTCPSDIKKGTFYLSWKYYKKQEIKAKFRIIE
ncbi:MAG TPA: three-Cys-motif partner protein TcmP [Phycisphaerales bacterium]|nr:three-Cys-motif partner protein TcmP [Phycisphaerales bacterium]